jgi:hypothetical protein
MRLSELLGCDVVDVDGCEVGKVHDVVLVQDGPLQGDWGAALRLESLMVGTGSIGTRLGLDRPGVHRPRIVSMWFARRKRYVVEWETVAERTADRITLTCRTEDLHQVEEEAHEPV